MVLLVRRRSPLATRAGRCGIAASSTRRTHLPFGDPLSQPSAGGIAQPLRRMLGGPLLAARESVEMPRPGRPAPGALRRRLRATPPAAAAAPRWPGCGMPLAAQAERLRDLTIRGCLSLSFGALVGLLALLAWLEAR